jgi:hypothetical protein
MKAISGNGLCPPRLLPDVDDPALLSFAVPNRNRATDEVIIAQIELDQFGNA